LGLLIDVNQVPSRICELSFALSNPNRIVVQRISQCRLPRYHDGRFLLTRSPDHLADKAKDFVLPQVARQPLIPRGMCWGLWPRRYYPGRMCQPRSPGEEARSIEAVVQWVAEAEVERANQQPVKPVFVDLMDKGKTVSGPSWTLPRTLALRNICSGHGLRLL